MVELNIFMGVMTFILLLGVIAEQDIRKQHNVTIAFVACVLLIIAVNTIMK